MKKERIPYFPFYPADFFLDPRSGILSAEEQGIWLLLLARLWLADAELPNDDNKLAMLLNMPVERWKQYKDRFVMSGLLSITQSGKLVSSRLTDEYLNSLHKKNQARAAINERWKKPRK